MDFMSVHQQRVARLIFSLAGMIAGFRITVDTRAVKELPRVFLMIANHQSLVDIPALIFCFPRHSLRYVAKKELGRGIPYISIGLRRGGHALISRTSDYREGRKALVSFARLTQQGVSPVVFPEGTRSRTGYVRGFHAGAVRIILERAPVPVLSVAIDGGFRISTLPRMIGNLRGARYRIRALSLYPAPTGKREILDLLARVESEISDQIKVWRKS